MPSSVVYSGNTGTYWPDDCSGDGFLRLIKIIVGSVVVVVLALAAGGAVAILMWDKAVVTAWSAEGGFPSDWISDIRSSSRVPGVFGAFTPSQPRDGNAAVPLLSDSSTLVGITGYREMSRKLALGDSLSVADSSLIQTALSDENVDSLLASAAMADYDSYEVIAAGLQSSSTLFDVPAPDLRRAIGLGSGALVRAWWSIRNGTPDSALANVVAVIRLGHMMYEGSSMLVGHAVGRMLIEQGVSAFVAYAAAAQDSAATAVSAELRNWVDGLAELSGLIDGLVSNPDSAAALILDSRVATPWRVEAMHQLVLSQFRPFTLLTGSTTDTRRVIESASRSNDHAVAGMAATGLATLDAYDALGPVTRLRWLRGLQPDALH